MTATFAADDFELRQGLGAAVARMRQARPAQRRGLRRLPDGRHSAARPTVEEARGRRSPSAASARTSSSSRSTSTRHSPTRSRRGCSCGGQAAGAREGLRQQEAPLHHPAPSPLGDLRRAWPLVRGGPGQAAARRWYWCGVFGELYGGANESRFAYDMQEVLAWLDGGRRAANDPRRELRSDPPPYPPDAGSARPTRG